MMIASDCSYKVYLIVLTFYRLRFIGTTEANRNTAEIKLNKIVFEIFFSSLTLEFCVFKQIH